MTARPRYLIAFILAGLWWLAVNAGDESSPPVLCNNGRPPDAACGCLPPVIGTYEDGGDC